MDSLYSKNEIVELNEKAGVLGNKKAKGKVVLVYKALWGFKYRVKLTSVIDNPFYTIGDEIDVREDWIVPKK